MITAADVLRLAGTREGDAAVEAFARRGAAALRELFDAFRAPKGIRSEAHPADFDAALTELVGRLACRHARTFIAEVTRTPALLEWSAVLAAAGRVRSRATDRWVFDALAHASQFHRVQALHILLARGEPLVRPRLRGLLRDRSDSVRFAAADGLRRWGVVDDIPELLRYAARAPIGGAERALDAIESISRRAGAPLPAAHPGERLVELEVAPAASVREVLRTARVVRAGELLAVVGEAELRAPADGLVVAFDRDPDGRLARIVLRTEPPGA